MGGALAGIQAGYNYALWKKLIVSGETDLQWSDVSTTGYSTGTSSLNFKNINN